MEYTSKSNYKLVKESEVINMINVYVRMTEPKNQILENKCKITSITL